MSVEKTVFVPIGMDRTVEMRKPSDGALIVMARVFKGLPKIENASELSDEQRDKMIRNLGTIGEIVESMIVNDADKDWLDDVMVSGKVAAEEVFSAVSTAIEKLNGSAAPAKAPAPVRRRR